MKATGIVRRIDDLGRIVIPKEIRRTLRIREGDPLEIYTEKDGEVIFKKYSPMGDLQAVAAQLCESIGKNTGHIAAVADRDSIIAVAGRAEARASGKAQLRRAGAADGAAAQLPLPRRREPSARGGVRGALPPRRGGTDRGRGRPDGLRHAAHGRARRSADRVGADARADVRGIFGKADGELKGKREDIRGREAPIFSYFQK